MSFHETGLDPDFESETHRLYRSFSATVLMILSGNGILRTIADSWCSLKC